MGPKKEPVTPPSFSPTGEKRLKTPTKEETGKNQKENGEGLRRRPSYCGRKETSAGKGPRRFVPRRKGTSCFFNRGPAVEIEQWVGTTGGGDFEQKHEKEEGWEKKTYKF